jgi:drug/metabolite transporter (DMT)-like permease
MLDPWNSLFAGLIKAWQGDSRRVRTAIITAILFVLIALTVALLADLGQLEERTAKTIAGALGLASGMLALGVLAYQGLRDQQAQQERIATVEERVREHPEKPQLAWDLARTKLENYLDRNLGQVRSIYWLTLFVMLSGFGFILYGLFHAIQSPEKLPVSIVASASGVIISFIGGSFLLIYRSILAQSKDYVTVLERINAVGMAVQVIASISEESAQLKHQTTADLAKQLLNLYAAAPVPKSKSSVSKG